ncbi:hypothetical protein U5801_12425 [Lamprobacter modestohalophilus]|nr:hypothetical protein [Lamprobacter modestohalophilus]MCF7977467.1 hypothetical protein [Chromatiaceae bacterium]MCF7994460.1 hypothetical protein [Chromatiaceae bacterium]MCF8004300.1 hypothetical protein [Chromatiaceae bacterium]MCF8015472.1 hypothetical protein [Chromatiaceae bacterium]MEA1050605.1 hypothetical protein [Lamprobacter modestohalophilus]
MLAPLAIVALLIGGTQAALVVSDGDVAKTDQTQVIEVQTVDTFSTAAE